MQEVSQKMIVREEEKFEIFSTSSARLLQDDSKEQFILNFADETIAFKPCQLIAFRRKILDIDLVSLFSSDTPDIEIVELLHCQRIFVLTLINIIELRELLQGAFTMLELNSLIHQTLVRSKV